MNDNILTMIKNDAQERKRVGYIQHGNISNQVKVSRAFVQDDSGETIVASLSTITIGRNCNSNSNKQLKLLHQRWIG